MIAGLSGRRSKPGELEGWRQDFGQKKLSIAVLKQEGMSI